MEDYWFEQGVTAREIDDIPLQQPVGFLAQHVEPIEEEPQPFWLRLLDRLGWL